LNEERCIEDSIDRLRTYLDGTPFDWELLVVDDGSRDGTVRIVERCAGADPRVRLLALPGSRHGKGAAVRHGMLAARGAWRFMADADLSMPPDNIGRLFAALGPAATRTHVAIGSREALGARRIGESWRRRAIGRVFNLVVQALALPGIWDTQCGFKLFSAEAVEAIFPRLTLDSFAFDVELLFLARRAGAPVREVGIDWHCRLDSRVSVRRGAEAFMDVLRVRWNAWLGRYDGIESALRNAPRGAPDHVASWP
jgi:glycosyltransferase involved in cell wall biosynthesis